MAKKRRYNSLKPSVTRHEGPAIKESSSDMKFERDMYRPVEYYAGESARRMQEMQDAGMIRSDYRAVANLPQDPVMREYPRNGGYIPEGIDDTIRGVDGQIGLDNARRAKTFHPKKV